MRSECFIEGQISIFEVPVIEGIKTKEIIVNVGIMPGEEILIVNIDKEINEIEKQKKI